jgi:hypothetical protein
MIHQTLRAAYPQAALHFIANLSLSGIIILLCVGFAPQFGFEQKWVPLLSLALFTPLAAAIATIPWAPPVRLLKKQILVLRCLWFVSVVLIAVVTLCAVHWEPIRDTALVRVLVLALAPCACSFLNFRRIEP